MNEKKYHVLAIAMSDSGSIVHYTREMTMTTERHVEPYGVGDEAEIMSDGRLTVTLAADLTGPDDLLKSWLVPGGVDALKLHLTKIVDEIGGDA